MAVAQEVTEFPVSSYSKICKSTRSELTGDAFIPRPGLVTPAISGDSETNALEFRGRGVFSPLPVGDLVASTFMALGESGDLMMGMDIEFLYDISGE